MKKLPLIITSIILLCITLSCQQGEEVTAESIQMTDEERASQISLFLCFLFRFYKKY
ncbi:MAG: hypothetical protein JSV96_15610 [Candidatus Aminicenantes bacterium]|nr:MAG: hypothetical protein JSV96_15610 [Candidatus Aminicenantes bacterium]